MAITSLVTFAGLVVAVHQFALKYVWDEHAHTRTLGGLLFMSLGFWDSIFRFASSGNGINSRIFPGTSMV